MRPPKPNSKNVDHLTLEEKEALSRLEAQNLEPGSASRRSPIRSTAG